MVDNQTSDPKYASIDEAVAGADLDFEKAPTADYLVRPSDYAAGQVMSVSDLTRYIQNKGRLSVDKLMPVMKPFVEMGFSETQLEAIVNIPFEAVAPKGRNEKIYHFMEAIGKTYSTEFLSSLTTNYGRFTGFLETIAEVEEFRTSVGEFGDASSTYEMCFNLIHELGKEKAEEVMSRLVEESTSGKSRVRKGIAAMYLMKDLVDESKRTGHDVEVLLEFRRNTMDQSHLSDDEEL